MIYLLWVVLIGILAGWIAGKITKVAASAFSGISWLAFSARCSAA